MVHQHRSTVRYRAEMSGALYKWLRNVPVADPIDRRNAPIMQILFLVVGTTLPINWARHVASIDVSTGWLHVMVADMAVALCAFAGIFAIRRGLLRVAVTTFCGSLLVSLLVGYVSLGFEKHMVDQTSQMLVLIVSGLVIGRRALWWVFSTLMTIFVLGSFVDEAAGRSDPFHFLPSAAFAYFVVTIVLDRCITALRASLTESDERLQRLEREIAERERVQIQLVHAQKMEMAGRMANGIAHDFNNVLGIISGLARERHRLDEPSGSLANDAAALADALYCVEKSAERGIEIARKLLQFSRADPSRPRIVELRQVLRGLQPLIKQMFPPAVLLRFDAGEQPCWVTIDLPQFELALLNIAANARDAMPHGGTFRIQLQDGQTHAVVRLSDTGEGMSEAVRAQAFEPFFSTKPPGSGTGLGLATTHAFVTAADGTIMLESESGHGTCVIIRLPRVPAGPGPGGASIPDGVVTV